MKALTFTLFTLFLATTASAELQFVDEGIHPPSQQVFMSNEEIFAAVSQAPGEEGAKMRAIIAQLISEGFKYSVTSSVTINKTLNANPYAADVRLMFRKYWEEDGYSWEQSYGIYIIALCKTETASCEIQSLDVIPGDKLRKEPVGGIASGG